MEFTLLWMKLQILKRGQGVLQNITQHKKHLKQAFPWMIEYACLLFQNHRDRDKGRGKDVWGRGKGAGVFGGQGKGRSLTWGWGHGLDQTAACKCQFYQTEPASIHLPALVSSSEQLNGT